MMKIFFAIFVFSFTSQAEQITLAPYLRTYPVSTSVEVSAKHDFVFWGGDNVGSADNFWQFGYLQPKVTLGAHGMAEASLQFAPISLLEFSIAYSKTSRFYETKPFNCSQVICKGIVDRHRYASRLALAFWGFESMLSYSKTRLSSPDSSKAIVDEVEVLLAKPSTDDVEAQTLYISKSGTPFGILVRKARFLGANVENESQYFVLRHKMEDVTYALGLGRYASDYSVPEFSVYAGVVWKWGESKALF